MRRLPYTLLLIIAAAIQLKAADPIISEFMASNQNSITDEDGEHSDWIEIRNPGTTSVNLAGWILADSKSRWVFPQKTLAAGANLIVFASGKNRTNPAGNLHTDFSLSASGEYLALIKPDGVTVATEFSPSYPQQYPDISYGSTVPVTDLVLLDKGSACRALVPTVANGGSGLGATWRQFTFDDSAWASGTLAVGYFNAGSVPDLSADIGLNVATDMYQINPSVFIRVPFSVPSPADIVQLKIQAQYDDGFAAFVNGSFATSKNSPTEANLAYNSAAVASHAPNLVDEVDVSGVISSLQAGPNVLAIQGLNIAASSSDVFTLPKLIAKVVSNAPPQIGYFATPTPGVINGGNETLLLPQTIVFSRGSGTFQSSFPLTLSGAVAGQEIRYVIANASAAGGTGANVPEPTSTSTLYTAPITIDQTKIIRAAVFMTGSTQKGQTATAQYLWLETGATNNTSSFTSSLPIVVINDHGFGEAVDSGTGTYTTSMMHIFEPVSGVATLNGALSNGIPNTFTRSGFRIRGSSSAGFPKKSYGIETWNEKNVDTDLPLIGLAADSDWILNGPYQYDDTYIHNAFIYEVSRRVGRWAPRTKVCEVFIDKNGGKLDYQDYNGIYVLTEKIKSNKERLPITSITPADISGQNLTGGYVFKIDRADPDEVQWHTANGVPHGGSTEFLVLTEPDPDVDTTQQIGYIQGTVQQFDTAIYSEAAAGFSTRNYRNFIDVPSFIDHHILNSLAFNVDALRLSAYFYKDRNKKINAGPIWDFDRSLGSDDGRDANPQSWNNITYFFTLDWWGQLFRDPDFVQAWVDRWWELRAPGAPFDYANLSALSTQMGNEIGNAAGNRDAVKWTADAPDAGQQYLNEITKMNSWLNQRLTWIDSQLPQRPNSNVVSSVVAPGTSVTLSGPGVLRYTIDGKDPRPPGGGTSSGALTYGGPITINQTTVITVRPQTTTTPFPGAVSISWGPPKTFVYLVNEAFALAGDIAISEINYHPVGPTTAEAAAVPGVTADDFEFIELRNIGAQTINTFELKFPAGFPFEKDLKLTAKSLNPGDFALVVRNRAAFTARYGAVAAAKIIGEWVDGSLSDGGEEIQLFARDGSAIQDFTYSDNGVWPGRADGKGSTLEYIGADFTNASYNVGTNWRSSSEFQGSPGAAGLGPDTRLVINEILANSAAPFVDAIELKNQTAAPLAIGGWYISDVGDPSSPDDFKQYRILAGTSISAGQYAVFTEVDFNPNGAWNPNAGVPGPTEFAFNADHGDDAWVLEADATGKILRFVDHVNFGPSRTNESLGRWPDATGSLYPMAQRTLFDEASATSPRPGLGAPNSLPRVGPLVITEIQHSPTGGDPNLQFIEIYNTTFQTVSLDHWRLRGTVDFNFSVQTIPPGQALVVVPFSPTDSAKVNAFKTAYGIGGAINLAGPWSSGDILATSGQVTLYRAGTPPAAEPLYYPQTVEDETAYSNGGAWPDATTGMSLNRPHPAGPGDAPASWVALAPNPGNIQNTVPVANNDTLHVSLNNGAATVQVLPNDTDGDGDALAILSVGTPAHGTATTDGKTISYTSSIFDSAPPNSTGEDSFTYTVGDGYGGTAMATVTLVNTRPNAVGDSYHLRYTGAPLVLNVLANDTDADSDAFDIYSVSNLATPLDTVSIVGNTIELTPANGTLEGDHSFSYTIRDHSGGFATASVTFTNNAPAATNDSFHGALVDGHLVIDVLANDSDADTDPLRISSVGNLSSPSDAATIDANKVVYTPANGVIQGNRTFTYTVTDDAGGVATGTVTVYNAAPTPFPDTLHLPLTGGDLVLNVLGNDTDPEGDSFTLTTVGQGAFGSTLVVGGTIHYQPTGAYHGSDTFSYTVADTNNATGTTTVTLVNQQPVANADVIVTDGTAQAIDVRANDTDGDNDALTITGVGSATYGTVTQNGTSVTYTPGLEFAGFDAFTYTISDGYGGTATANVTVKSSGLLTVSEAETGKEVPDADPGTLYKSLQVPAIGSDGQLAWVSTVSGPAGRKSMLVARRPSRIVAKQGDVAVALNDGSKFTKFNPPVVDGTGRVVFVGTVAGAGVSAKAKNNMAIFASHADVNMAVVARLGGEPAGVPGAKFAKFVALDATDGETLFVAKLARNLGGVTAANDTGVWAWDGTTTRLVARTGAAVTPAVGAKTISSLSLLNAVSTSPGHGRTHRGGRVALRLGFTDKTTGLGLASFAADAWTVEVMTVSGTNPALTGTSWKTIGVPSLASPGSVAALTTLLPAVAPAASDTAITLFDGTGATEIAREGSPSPITGANYKSFKDPASSAEGEVVFAATISGLGVTAANNTVLIDRSEVGQSNVVARTGQPATDAAGALWKRFTSFAVASGETHGPVFLAQLSGPGVTKRNNLGLWATDSAGATMLIARTEQTIKVAGVDKTLAKMTLLNALPPVQGSSRSFNSAHEVAYLATFTDKTQAVLSAFVP